MKLTPRSSNTSDATKTVALNSELPIVDPILQHLESGKPPTSQKTNAPCTAEITKPTRLKKDGPTPLSLSSFKTTTTSDLENASVTAFSVPSSTLSQSTPSVSSSTASSSSTSPLLNAFYIGLPVLILFGLFLSIFIRLYRKRRALQRATRLRPTRSPSDASIKSYKSGKPFLKFEVMTDSLQKAADGKVIDNVRVLPMAHHKESMVQKVVGRKLSEDSTSSNIIVIVERIEEEP